MLDTDQSAAAPTPAPATLAWVGQRFELPTALAQRWEGGAARFIDSDDFLLDAQAYAFDVFVIDLVQRGVRGVDLVRLVRRRSHGVVLALAEGGEDDWVAALNSGADMVLPASATASADLVLAAIQAVQRRQGRPGPEAVAATAEASWTFLAASALLRSPDGKEIPLNDTDVAIVACLADAGGNTVAKQTLIERLWGQPPASMVNALHAAVYRLRRRIEQTGTPWVPLQSVSRQGYRFRAPLVRG